MIAGREDYTLGSLLQIVLLNSVSIFLVCSRWNDGVGRRDVFFWGFEPRRECCRPVFDEITTLFVESQIDASFSSLHGGGSYLVASERGNAKDIGVLFTEFC